MRERQAQFVLLARSFEEVDRGGRVLSLDERDAATRHALMVTTLEGARGRFPAHIGIVDVDGDGVLEAGYAIQNSRQ